MRVTFWKGVAVCCKLGSDRGIGAAPMGASVKTVQKTLASGCVAFLLALQMMIGFMGPLYEYNGYLGSGIGGITADIFEARLSKRPSLFKERLRCLMQRVRLARKGVRALTSRRTEQSPLALLGGEQVGREGRERVARPGLVLRACVPVHKLWGASIRARRAVLMWLLARSLGNGRRAPAHCTAQ